jgi:hypothetical protein
MRKIDNYLGVFLLVIATGVGGQLAAAPAGATLAGVTMPDTATVDGKTLVLNGLGVRSEFMVKVYVAGLYVERKSPDADAIIKANTRKRIVLQFLHDVSRDQIVHSFDESFTNNSREAVNRVKPGIASLESVLEAVKPGDQMVFTIVPDKGTTFSLNGHDKVTIADPAFAPVLLSVWLGPKPPTAAVKKGLLGQ